MDAIDDLPESNCVIKPVPPTAATDRPMHLLVLPSWYPTQDEPASGIFFRDQALALHDLGLHVGVIAPEVVGARAFLKRANRTIAIHHENDRGVQTYRKTSVPLLPKFSRRNAWFWMNAGRIIFIDYVQREGMPDLIHAHGVLHGGLLARRIRKSHGIPYVITEHSSIFAEGRVRRWMARPAGTAFAKADTRLVVSAALGALLTARYSDRFCPWQSVPNMIGAEFEASIEDKPPTDSGRITFLCVGNLQPIKAQDVLISAFAQRFRGDLSARLRLAGKGGKEADCRQLAHKLGVAKQVEFLGQLDRQSVRREMLAADALVLPSYYDTFGVVAIEALACGTPVIATRGSGPESIVDENSGMLVSPGDVPGLARALGDMREARAGFQPDALRNACLARFGRNAVAGRLVAIYDETLRRTGSGSIETNG